jgi:phosphate transport system protein
MKRFFHAELEEFRSTIVLMGELAMESVRGSLQALREVDPVRAEAVIKGDNRLDQLEKVIDAEALRYITLRAPVASELRLLTVGMKAGHDLERVGDEATNMAKKVRKMAGQPPPTDFGHIPEMAEIALGMLRDSLDAFLEADMERAYPVIARDKQVDDLNRANFDAFASRIAADPTQVHPGLLLISISKSIERVADHATNIAEEVVYLLSGEDLRHSKKLKKIKRGILPEG